MRLVGPLVQRMCLGSMLTFVRVALSVPQKFPRNYGRVLGSSPSLNSVQTLLNCEANSFALR